ncbi:response regulator [Flavisphingomonas formosensis]|uniref:response regulator n=1 Tax=Flavisphingomonas formosensis TaxID=861534 RepID=UPI0012F8B725|nr:response regulator [Sphingomonas formosensis]
MDQFGLTGRYVLVLEDDYFIASEVSQALQNSGANIIGPFGSEASAITAINRTPPDLAILDLNLGAGQTFAAARALRKEGIPFFFLTGYDQWAIPPEFRDIPLLEKPVGLTQVVRTVDMLLDNGAARLH